MRVRGRRGQDARAAPDKQDAWRIISHYVQLPPTAWSESDPRSGRGRGACPALKKGRAAPILSAADTARLAPDKPAPNGAQSKRHGMNWKGAAEPFGGPGWRVGEGGGTRRSEFPNRLAAGHRSERSDPRSGRGLRGSPRIKSGRPKATECRHDHADSARRSTSSSIWCSRQETCYLLPP